MTRSSLFNPQSWILFLFLFAAASAIAATDVLTNNYDNNRTGANLQETILNTSNVQPQSFGRVASFAVDGPVFSQPLIVTDLHLPGKGSREVVYVTTANNFVYAFDAGAKTSDPLWQTELNLLPSGQAATVKGILSTPVIDRAKIAIYVVAGLLDGTKAKFVLHALSLIDGSEIHGGPVVIAGAVTVGEAQVPFEPSETRVAVQRAALALAQGKVIVAFGGDYFEGWVFAFDESNLKAPPSAFCTTCVSRVKTTSKIDYLDQKCIYLGPGGGIWQSGRGPVVDDRGLVYFFTGNKAHVIRDGCVIPMADNACAVCAVEGGCPCKGGNAYKVCRGADACNAHQSADGRTFETNESLVQLDPRKGLALTGWFRPANWNGPGVSGLERNDLDLGGSGPLLLPGTTRLIGGGKEGVMYLLDTAPTADECVPSLGETCLSPPLQSFAVAAIPPRPNEYYRHILGGPVVWSRSTQNGGSRAFVWRENDYLRSYALSDRFLDCTSANDSSSATHDCSGIAQSKDFVDYHRGGVLSLSAHGSEASSAIVWAVTSPIVNGPAKLMAFEALPDPATPNELTKIWDSSFCEGDSVDIGPEFVPPTVANGKVYVATGSNRVDVFSLIPKRECVPPPPTLMGPMLQ